MTTPVGKTDTDLRCLNQEVIARTDIYSETTLKKNGEELELCYHRLPSHEDTFTKYVVDTLKDGPAKDVNNRVSMRLSFYSKEGEKIEHRFALDPNNQVLSLRTAQELDAAYGKMAGLTLTIPEEEMIRAEIDRRIELVASKYKEEKVLATLLMISGGVFGGLFLAAGTGSMMFSSSDGKGVGFPMAVGIGAGFIAFAIGLSLNPNSKIEKESGAGKWKEVLEKYSPSSGSSAFLPPSFSTSSGMYSSSGTQFSLGFRW